MGNKLLASLIIVLTIFWCLNIILGVIAGATENKIFKHKTGDVSNNYPTQVTPQNYAFKICYLIFAWLLAAYIFLTICIFIPSKDGLGKVFCSPEVFNTSVASLLILNSALYISWLFLWDNEHMIPASAIMFCVMATNWLALGIFSFRLRKSTRNLQKRSPIVLNCYRVLVQNGLGLYTACTTITALINLAVTLIYDAEIADPTPSFISLGILTMILIIWIPLDVFLIDKYCRYMITPLFSVVWTLVGIFLRLDEVEYEDNTPKHFTIGLIGVVGVLLIGRVILTLFRAIRLPLK